MEVHDTQERGMHGQGAVAADAFDEIADEIERQAIRRTRQHNKTEGGKVVELMAGSRPGPSTEGRSATAATRCSTDAWRATAWSDERPAPDE